MLLPLSVPPARINPAAPVLPSLPPDSCSHCSRLLCLPNALLGRMAVRLDHQKVTMQDQSQLWPVSWFQLLTASNKKKGNRIWTEAQREIKQGGRWGAVCMASYSYLALSPILTSSLACAWITDNECTTFSTGLNPFNVVPLLYLRSFFPLHVGYWKIKWKKL